MKNKWLYILLLSVSFGVFAEEVVIYKTPSCGCCQKWADGLKAEGYNVEIHDTDNIHAIKNELGVPAALGSCHTATINGYVIEGHVPVGAIDSLLKNKSDVLGIAVPGMPTGSLGMESGEIYHKYTVYSFDKNGTINAESQYQGSELMTQVNK